MRHAELTDLQISKIISAIGNRYGIIKSIGKYIEEKHYYFLRYPEQINQGNYSRVKIGLIYDPSFEIIEFRSIEQGQDINDGKIIGFAHVSLEGNLDIEISEDIRRYEE